jgi:hypothetical protein
MLLTVPFARTALLLALAALATTLMLARFTVLQQQGMTARPEQTVSHAEHTPVSTAHARHASRLRVDASAVTSGG